MSVQAANIPNLSPTGVTVLDLILGNKISVETLDGVEHIQIPKLSQLDDRFVINGKGIKLPSGNRGNFIVWYKLVLPKELNETELKLLCDLSLQENFSTKN